MKTESQQPAPSPQASSDMSIHQGRTMPRMANHHRRQRWVRRTPVEPTAQGPVPQFGATQHTSSAPSSDVGLDNPRTAVEPCPRTGRQRRSGDKATFAIPGLSLVRTAQREPPRAWISSATSGNPRQPVRPDAGLLEGATAGSYARGDGAALIHLSTRVQDNIVTRKHPTCVPARRLYLCQGGPWPEPQPGCR